MSVRHYRVSFYRGRQKRGCTLEKVFAVICDYWDASPFKRDEYGVPLFTKLGLHEIKLEIHP